MHGATDGRTLRHLNYEHVGVRDANSLRLARDEKERRGRENESHPELLPGLAFSLDERESGRLGYLHRVLLNSEGGSAAVSAPHLTHKCVSFAGELDFFLF